jgi:hypothetical protein
MHVTIAGRDDFLDSNFCTPGRHIHSTLQEKCPVAISCSDWGKILYPKRTFGGVANFSTGLGF